MAKKQNDIVGTNNELETTDTIESSVAVDTIGSSETTDTVETPVYEAKLADNETPVYEAPVEAPVEGTLIEYVTAVIPHNYTLRIDNHRILNFVQGTQKMEREHAEHWFSVANGVTIFKG